jgi:hypothetical protein
MSLQVLAALSNAIYLEHMPWSGPLYNEAIEMRDGMAPVPERPGSGFTFDLNAVERYRVWTPPPFGKESRHNSRVLSGIETQSKVTIVLAPPSS